MSQDLNPVEHLVKELKQVPLNQEGQLTYEGWMKTLLTVTEPGL